MKINNLQDGGGPQILVGFIRNLVERTTKAGGPYISFDLYDNENSIPVRIWSTSMEEMKERGLENGSFVISKGNASTYNDQLQFAVSKQDNILHIRPVRPEDGVDIGDYTPMAPVSPEEMDGYIRNQIDQMKDQELKGFIQGIYDDYQEKLLASPASIGVHHEYLNGLGYHVYRMLKAAMALSDVYEASVDRDYLVVGVILHDIGKIKCYNVSEDGNPESYTVENDLLGHIAMGILMLEDYQISEDKKNMVRHLILSHHGKREYGAVVSPMTIEAQILHFVDNIDSKVTIYERELANLEEGQVSPRIWSVDSKIYKVKE